MAKLLILPLYLAGTTASLPAAVWPPPRSATCVQTSNGRAFSSNLRLVQSGAGAKSDITVSAEARYLPLLKLHSSATGTITDIHVNVKSSTEALDHTTDYGYSIIITVDSAILEIVANSPFGVSYALETLTQFIDPVSGLLACSSMTVDDAPAYAHRGIMIDTGRRFYPVALVEQTIEGMAMTKQNVLHLHLSEECFRVQSDVYPQLTASCIDSSGNNTAFYTKDDIKHIVEFSRLRGVRVLPEFDMPGHSGGFCTSLKSAGIACCGSQIEDDPAGASAKIIASILSEMAALFPDAVMNLGCDETGSSAPCTLNNTKSFEIKMIEHLLSVGKRPMGWEEILFKTGAAAEYPTTIVDSWARTSWSQAAAAGHDVVMSNNGLFYLDSAGHSARKMWLNISAVGNATYVQGKHLLGGETSMWQDRYVSRCVTIRMHP